MLALSPRRWPLAFKAPASVVVFMLAVSAGLTYAVLDRLKDTQERHLAALSSTYLDGLASAVLPYVLRGDVWEVFDVIDRGAALGGGFGRAEVVVTDAGGDVIAAAQPVRFPVGSRPEAIARRFAAEETLVVDAAEGMAHARRRLVYQGREIGRLYADFDIRHLLAERAEVLRTLILTNALLTAALAALAYGTIRRMLSPLAMLSRHIGRTVAGPLEPIRLEDAGDPDGEFARLFRRYNTLIEALAEREVLARRLADEERVASLGRLASGMAHEINNPLGGLFNAIDTLKRHGAKPEVRRQTLDLIERGLRGIRDVVRTALATYRADPAQRSLAAADLDDIRLLARPEIARKGLDIDWRNDVAEALPLPASAARQVLLNLLLNAVAATPEKGRVAVSIQTPPGALLLAVEDSGPGLTAAAEEILAGRRTRPEPDNAGGGLGLWVCRRIAVELGGSIATGRSALGGARVAVRLPLAEGDLRRAA